MSQTFSLHHFPDAKNIILSVSDNPIANNAIVSFVVNERIREASKRIDQTNEVYTERVKVKEGLNIYVILTQSKDIFVFSQQDAANFYYNRYDNVLCKIIEGIDCKIDTYENLFDDESLDDLISRLLEHIENEDS